MQDVKLPNYPCICKRKNQPSPSFPLALSSFFWSENLTAAQPSPQRPRLHALLHHSKAIAPRPQGPLDSCSDVGIRLQASPLHVLAPLGTPPRRNPCSRLCAAGTPWIHMSVTLTHAVGLHHCSRSAGRRSGLNPDATGLRALLRCLHRLSCSEGPRIG
jgi:hypothetical protein